MSTVTIKNSTTLAEYNVLLDDTAIPSVTGLLDATAHSTIDHTGLIGIPAGGGTGGGVSLGETSITAYRGDRGKLAYDHSQTAHATQYTDAMAQAACPAETDVTIKATLGITTLSGSNTGDQVIPTTLPASDVYSWAKAATKPTYTKSEVGLSNVPNLAFSGSNTGDQDLSGLAPLSHAARHLPTGADPVTANFYHGVVSRTTVAPLPTVITTTSFVLACTATPLSYYFKGKLVTVNADCIVVINAAAGKYFVYFSDAVGTLTHSAVFPDQFNNVLVATVVWNGTDYGVVSDERHNSTRDIDWHLATHEGIGTRYVSGLDFSFTGATNINTTFSVSAGQINDEDIKFSIGTQTQCRLWYQTGADTYAFFNALSTLPYYYTTGLMAVNGSTYALLAAPVTLSNRFFNIWMYASTDVLAPIYCLIETVPAGNIGGYTSAALARAVSPPNIGVSNLSTELKLLRRIVVNGAGLVQAPVAADDYRTGGSIPGGGTASTSHNGLSNVELAATGVAYGHINDQPQTIAGAKTFTDGVVLVDTVTAIKYKIIIQDGVIALEEMA